MTLRSSLTDFCWFFQIKIAERDHERDLYRRENQRLRQQLHLIQDEETVENTIRVSMTRMRPWMLTQIMHFQDLSTSCEPDDQPEP